MDYYEEKKRKRNPRETANVFSLLSFAYTACLFKKALQQKSIEEDDLYAVLKPLTSSKCGNKIEKQWALEYNKKSKKHPSIYRLLWDRFGLRYILMGTTHVTWKIFSSIVEPWAISNLIAYFKPNQTTMTKTEACYFTALVLVLNVLYAIFINNYIIWLQQLGVEIKTSLSSLLYRKALKLSPSAISEITLGNIVTLITKDVHAFQHSIWIVNEGWIAIIQATVMSYLLYAKIGSVAFIGIGVVLSAIPLQVLLGHFVNKFRLAAGHKTDQRLQIIQETLSTIKIIKMYKWEEYFRKKIDDSRLKEINRMLIGFYLKIIINMLGGLFSKVGFYVLIMSCIWTGISTEAEIIFYLASVFNNLKYSLGIIIPVSIGRGAEILSSIIRINKVITGEELPPKLGSDNPTDNPSIELTDVTVNILSKTILKDVTLNINKGLILVTGTVGSGKSALLKTILQDYPLSEGHFLTFGRFSYASQDPWLFPSTIKQNILFGEKFNETRYQQVLKVCALEYDLSLFVKGDETIVTDKGLNLSKGQQARVNLARAVYKESEMYLLDDSLTALDAHVQDYIFNECIKTFLKDKICILVTQIDSHIQEADTVIIMHEGQIKYNGKPNEKVINEIVIEDDDLEKEIIDREKNLNKKNEDLIETISKIYTENNKKGEVDFNVHKKYISYGGGCIVMFLILVLLGVNQGTESYSESLLTKWIDEQQLAINIEKNITNQLAATLQQNEDLSVARSKEQYTIKLYTIIMMVGVVLGLIKTYAVFDFCRRASINIHKTIVKRITYAVMSFFDTHFIGNILNRFSQDMTNIDEHLLYVFSESLNVTFAVAGIIILIATVSPYFLLFAAVFFLGVFFLRKIYLPTGRSLKRLEAACSSAGSVGLTLTQVFMLTGLVQWGVRTWADLENLMTSVERLLEYTEIPLETKFGIEINDWPKDGAIVYDNVSLTYNNSEMVLKNLNFKIESGQKIGIVGRTGAGKSSIISTIFRLYEPEGNILIDGVNIKSLTLHFLRKKLAIIPQDPILFSGTIRTNLDPLKEFKDEELWKVLEEVNIKTFIPNLDMKITNSAASNFSSGQKQLVCLARAILRKARIVILDEATANMDHGTDMLLNNTIQKTFVGCTVLTIAHRLHSILESDKVVVLDRGEIKEFDEPRILLKNKQGIFYKMVSNAGMLNYLNK